MAFVAACAGIELPIVAMRTTGPCMMDRSGDGRGEPSPVPTAGTFDRPRGQVAVWPRGGQPRSAFAGAPDVAIAEIERRHDAIGFDEACLTFATGCEATTPEALSRAVTLFADEDMPAFADD